MRKNNLLFLFVLAAAAFAAGCDKGTVLPVQSVSNIFSASKLNHTADTVNVGDTIYLTATGTVADTTKTISAFLTAAYTAGGVSSVYSFGSSSSPVKLNRTIGALNNGLYGWTATIPLTGATNVPHKTAITVAATFMYQLSLSSQLPSNLTVSDSGMPGGKQKTVYVR